MTYLRQALWNLLFAGSILLCVIGLVETISDHHRSSLAHKLAGHGVTATAQSATVDIQSEKGHFSDHVATVTAELPSPALTLHLQGVTKENDDLPVGSHSATELPSSSRYKLPLPLRYLSSDPEKAMAEADLNDQLNGDTGASGDLTLTVVFGVAGLALGVGRYLLHRRRR